MQQNPASLGNDRYLVRECPYFKSSSQMLYKFIADPDVLTFLLQGIVRFTPISELNDPSECVPTINAIEVRASLRQLREQAIGKKTWCSCDSKGICYAVWHPNFKQSVCRLLPKRRLS